MNSRKLAFAFVAFAFFASLCMAQSREYGSFVGTVFDTEGSRLPGVAITVKNVDMGLTQSTVTNEQGRYRIERLPRGIYTVTATLAGFKTLIKEGFDLAVGSELKVDFTLEIGMIEEEVTVVGTSPLVETTRAQVSTVITEREFLSYPQGNRDYTTLIAYAPGAVPDTDAQGFNNRSGFAINGNRASANNFMIDGLDNNDNGTAGAGIYNTTTLPPEAIQEFRLVSNNFSAEYGRNSGGIINAVMRSGTNEFHGTGWVFHRGDSALFQTEDWLTHDRPPLNRWQFGGTFGGPIIKDKTFFFASFERVTQKQEARTPYYFFTPEAIARSQGAARYYFDNYGDAYPVPTYDFIDVDGDGLTDAGRYVWDGTTYLDGMNFGFKLDHIFSEKDRIAVRWLYNNLENSFDFDNLPGFRKAVPYAFHTGGLTWLHLFSGTMYNEVRVGYHRDYNDWPRLAPEIPSLGGYTFFSDGVHSIGDWTNMPQEFANNTYQLVDVLNFQTGNHSIKIGGEIRYWNSESTFDAFVSGGYYFNDSTWFLYDLGAYYLFLGADPPDPPENNPYVKGDPYGQWARGDSHRKWKGFEGGAFVQDDWRVTDRLTLSLGLRWEYFGVPEETSGTGINMPAFGTEQGYLNTQAGNYDITEGTYNREGVRYMIFDGRELHGKKLWNPYYKAFAPKISFAYDLTGDGKTSIRGGWAVSYDRTFNNTYENDRFNYPDFTFVGFGEPPMIPVSFPAEVPMANVTGFGASLRWMQPDLKPQKAYNWMFGVQRELGPNVVLEVNYTGSAGRNLGSIQRPNRFTGDRLDGVPDGINNQTAIRGVNVREQTLKSDFHALTVTLQKRFSDGWSWYTAYTYGQAKDQNSDYFGDNNNMEAVSHDRLEDEYGYAQYDRRSRLVGGFVWEMPWWRNADNWILKNVLGGWQLAGNFHYTSGQPFTIAGYVSGTDWNGDYDYYDRPIWNGGDYQDLITWTDGRPGWDQSQFSIPNPPAYPDDMSYYDQNFVPRNAFRWFPTYNLNISLQKSIIVPMGSRDLTFQLIAEVFNVFNNRFWLLPSTSWTSANFGYSTRMNNQTNLRDRSLQLSLRVIF